MKIQEASEDLQMGEILFSKYRGKLFWRQRPKNDENQRFGPGRETKAPRAWKLISCA